ncbi:hypothetical protein ACFFLM_00200 [Deinococcus oregonensis]|uniref:Uncharacterized protein n=1 Tax=Deinococcus oregonensis TaxID=1805970 RepID=A0ABV6ASE6_9DEIO
MPPTFPLPETPDELAARLEFLRLWNLQIDAKRWPILSAELEREVIAAERCWRREQEMREVDSR